MSTNINKSASIYIDGKQVDNTLKSLSAEAAKLKNALANMVPGSAEFNAKSQSLRAVRGQIDAINTSVSGVNKNWQSFKNNLAATATGVLGGSLMVAGVNAITSGLSSSVKKAAELSDIFADIQKTTGLTAEEVQNLSKELARIDTRTSKNDLLGIAKVAGQFGIAKDQVLGFVKAIDMVNVALGDEFQGGPEAIATEMSKLRNVFTDIKTQNYGADIKYIANVLNELGAAGVATGPVVADIANRIGGVGIQAGLSTAQVLGISAAMQELNISTERGSTAVVKILQKMLTETETFARIAGKPIAEFKKQLDTDLYGAFMSVLEGSRRVGSSSTLLAGVIKDLELQGAGASEVFAKFGSNSALVAEKVGLANRAINETNSLADEFQKKNENLAASIEKLEKRWNKFWTSARATDFWTWMVEGGNKAIDALENFSDFVFSSGNAFLYQQKRNAREAEKLAAEQAEKDLAIQEAYQVKLGRMKADELAAERQALTGQLGWYKSMREEISNMSLAEKQKVLQEINGIKTQMDAVNKEFAARKKQTGGGAAASVAMMSAEEIKERDKQYEEIKKALEKLQNDAQKLKHDYELKQMSADEAELQRIRDKYQVQIDEALKYEQRKDANSEQFRQVRLQLEAQRDIELKQKKAEQQALEDQERVALSDRIYLETLSDFDREMAATANHYEQLIIAAEKLGLDTTKLYEARNNAMLGIAKKYQEQDLKNTRETNQQKLEEEMRMQQAQAQLVSNFGYAMMQFNRLVGSQEGELTEFQKSITLTQIALDTASAISSVTSKNAASSLSPIDYAIKVTAAIGTVLANMATARQLVSSAKTPAVPQFVSGGESYTVTGQQTGKQYRSNWVGSFARGGVYRNASLGLIGEEGTELVIPNWLYTAPAMMDTMGMLRGMIARGYTTGGESVNGGASVQGDNISSISAAIAKQNVLMEALLIRLNMPIYGVAYYGPQEAEQFREILTDLTTIDRKAEL